MLEKNKIYTADITDLTAEGNGVCHIDGIAVFVPQTAVGDKADIKIVKVMKNYCFGIIDKLISPSTDRIENDCPVFNKCGGCLFRHISYDAECKIKNDIVKNAFKRIGGLDPEFEDFCGSEKICHYRNKAQFPIGKENDKAICGFFAPRSHRVIPVENCPLQPEIFKDILKTILDYINVKKLSVYDESSNTGILRHIYLRQGAHSEQIMVCFVVRKDITRELSPLAEKLHHEYENVCSIIMNINPDKTNVILGKKNKSLYGQDQIQDIMCGNTINISAHSFYQVNTEQAEKLYAKACEYADPKPTDTLVDLYCGVGTIGLSMADQVRSVIGIEIIPDAIYNAKTNAEQNHLNNTEFHCGDAGEVFGKLRQQGCNPNIIIVDPPRKGCSDETIRLIANAQPEKIVMISCNPATAARDAKLLNCKGYSVNKVCGYDLFPRTGHVECVVLMSREKK